MSGANTNRLTVFVEGTACFEDYSYYCVITNPNGSVTTRYAALDAQHVFDDYIDNGDGTHSRCCIGDGCGETEEKTSAHSYGEWKLVKPAAEDDYGLKTRKCSDCGHIDSFTIPMTGKGHVHSYSEIKYSPSGHWKECKCGLRDSEKPEKHDYNSWITSVEATENHSGKRYHRCKVCNYVEYETIPKLPHTHNFTDLKKSKLGRYDLPNGYMTEEYHVRCCTGCTSVEKEPHTYYSWRIMNSPFTDKNGVYHKGEAHRSCTVCGYGQTQYFTGEWPLLVEVFNSDNSEGFGGAVIDAPVAANTGDKIMINAKAIEGYVIPAVDSSWSLNEVNSTDYLTLKGKNYPYKNDDITDFQVTSGTTVTFTMPNGPVALMVFVKKCGHGSGKTYEDYIEPSCTGYGGKVKRCFDCDAVLEYIERENPLGHDWKQSKVIREGDCDHREFVEMTCSRCGKSKQCNGDFAHDWEELENAVPASCNHSGSESDMQCKVCGVLKAGKKIEKFGHHSWSEWITLIKPTTKTKGRAERYCSVCGADETKILDYSGPDYQIKADKNMIRFDFTLGEKVEPVVINVSSVGRDKAQKILDVRDAQVAQQYNIEITGDMQVTVTPDPTGIFLAQTVGQKKLFDIYTADTDENGDFVSTTVAVSSNIKVPKERFKLNLTGAKAAVYNSALGDFEEIDPLKTNISAGTILRITADDDKDFKYWNVYDVP